MASPERFGLVGPSYTSQSLNADAQLTMNLYPEVDESGAGNAPIVLYPTPGTALFTGLSGEVVDKVVSEGGTSATAAASGTPSQAGEVAIYVEVNGLSSGPPGAISPGTGWTLIDNPAGGGQSSMYSKFLPTGATVSETQAIAGAIDSWATLLAFFGSSSGLSVPVVQDVTLVSGAFNGLHTYPGLFVNPITSGNAIMLLVVAANTNVTATGVTVTDSQGNVYTLIGNIGNVGGVTLQMWLTPSAKPGVTTTTYHQATGFYSGCTIKAYEISGVGLL